MKKIILTTLFAGLSLFASGQTQDKKNMEITPEEYSIILHEEIDSFKKKLPINLDKTNNIVLYSAAIEKDTINYYVKLNLMAFEKDTKLKVTTENLKILQPTILGSFRNAQISGLCSNEETLKIFQKGYSIQYNYEFDNSVKIGSNKINMNTCKNLYQKAQKPGM